MGRYDGEEYEKVAPCAPEKHSFGMNGICFSCRYSRQELINNARKTLEVLWPSAVNDMENVLKEK